MSAGLSHAPVMLRESVAALVVRSDGIYVDATFGRGGHSREILRNLDAHGRLVAIDRDEQAITVARELHDTRVTVFHQPFSELARTRSALGVPAVSGVLFDLGMSSPQLDDASRGFSFRHDGPLDMRMDRSQGPTAADWLQQSTEEEIREVIKNYGEERFAKQIAAALVSARARRPLTTTRELATLVAHAVRTREPGQDPATRTFQALRIFLNQELAQLSLALPLALDWLEPGGRLVAISFHSLEDRIVKQTLRDAADPAGLLPRLPLTAAQLPQPTVRLLGRAQRPSAEEIAANPRARSAIMRVAEKL